MCVCGGCKMEWDAFTLLGFAVDRSAITSPPRPRPRGTSSVTQGATGPRSPLFSMSSFLHALVASRRGRREWMCAMQPLVVPSFCPAVPFTCPPVLCAVHVRRERLAWKATFLDRARFLAGRVPPPPPPHTGTGTRPRPHPPTPFVCATWIINIQRARRMECASDSPHWAWLLLDSLPRLRLQSHACARAAHGRATGARIVSTPCLPIFLLTRTPIPPAHIQTFSALDAVVHAVNMDPRGQADRGAVPGDAVSVRVAAGEESAQPRSAQVTLQPVGGYVHAHDDVS